ncbi:hypothetical protein QYM46_05135 [Brevibacterium sp. K11IcPPYGO002]|uniref:hypothetical protein n=1 Tax=Brevibacterium sp. K11IcPPYGO002 TaxID=3058837 RepID=UPI003D8162FA
MLIVDHAQFGIVDEDSQPQHRGGDFIGTFPPLQKPQISARKRVLALCHELCGQLLDRRLRRRAVREEKSSLCQFQSVKYPTASDTFGCTHEQTDDSFGIDGSETGVPHVQHGLIVRELIGDRRMKTMTFGVGHRIVDNRSDAWIADLDAVPHLSDQPLCDEVLDASLTDLRDLLGDVGGNVRTARDDSERIQHLYGAVLERAPRCLLQLGTGSEGK